jgi:hypothetical protein
MHLDVALLPKSLVRHLPVRPGLEHHANVLLSTALIVLVVLNGRLLTAVESLPHWCLFKTALGIPCPGCGMTRSLSFLANGAVVSSWQLQPCGVLLAAVVLLQSITRVALLLGWATEKAANELIRNLGNWFIVALLMWWLFKLTP